MLKNHYARYFIHYALAFIIFLSITVLGHQIDSQAQNIFFSSFKNFYHVLSNVLFLCLVHHFVLSCFEKKGLFTKRNHFISTDIISVIVASFLSLSCDICLELLIVYIEKIENFSFLYFMEDILSEGISELLDDFQYTACFWVVAQAFSRVLNKKTKSNLSQKETHFRDENKWSGFFKEIPVHMHSEIYAIEAQQNYIKVIFSEKKIIILYRLKNAIQELGEDVGIQTHRSYWVSRFGFKKIDKIEGKVVIVLKNDLKIPLSRTYQKSVKEYFKMKHSQEINTRFMAKVV